MLKTKYPCEYCHAMTTDDRKGHCAACGAPRENEVEKVKEPRLPTEDELKYWMDFYDVGSLHLLATTGEYLLPSAYERMWRRVAGQK